MTYRMGPKGTGLASGTSTTKNVTGSGCAFDTQLQEGDPIYILLVNGTIVARIIDEITGANALTVTVAFSDTFSDRPFYSTRAAATLFGVDPQSTPGRDYVLAQDGLLVAQGYARSTWGFTSLDLDTLYSARALLMPSAYSGEVCVETIDDARSGGADVFSVYRALARFSLPETTERWGGRRQRVKIDLTLVEKFA